MEATKTFKSTELKFTHAQGSNRPIMHCKLSEILSTSYMLMGCVSGYLRSCLAHVRYKVSGWKVLLCNSFVLKLVLQKYVVLFFIFATI